MYIEGCSLLSPPINGDVSIDGIQVGLPNHFLYINGSSASYNCDNGYAISTSENTTRYCEHNGSSFIWSGIPPTCSPIGKYNLTLITPPIICSRHHFQILLLFKKIK